MPSGSPSNLAANVEIPIAAGKPSENAGLSAGFHAAAAEVFEQMALFKAKPAADIVELLKALNQSSN